MKNFDCENKDSSFKRAFMKISLSDQLTIVEPVSVGHWSANDLKIESGSLSLGALARGGLQDEHGLVKSFQLSLVGFVKPAGRGASGRAAGGTARRTAQGARRCRPGKVSSSLT